MTTPNQPRLLREFIEIPESMNDADFVLELASGVSHAEETLREYVITDSLLTNFDHALGLIKASITGQRSKAAYLHGSFGAGKSHFMAVLHAVLRGEKVARERPEFAALLAKHDWMDGRKFLLVPLHLLGAKSLEQRVFGRYIDYVRVLHPGAQRIPAVHRSDALLDQMRNLREKIGDEKFIADLPGGEVEDEWGESSAFWTTEKLDAAFASAYEEELRRRLVNDLLQTWGRGFFRDAKEDAEAFVSLDAGLKEISRHANELGYDGLILFLDELVLWLINSAGDAQFVSREMQKVTNFVESGDPDRPVPVVSFIARQRDLREALGEGVSGAVELRILDTLDLAKARFDTVTLEDRNLPVIARERVLKPKNTEAEAAIARAFEQTAKLRQQVWDTLLGSGGGTGADIEAFRKTYPFSPAFMDTLVYLSSALQRSRTALKLMRKLLIRRREELRLGQLVPLGDLYDVITEGGDEPFTQKLKVEFEAAQKLYETRLRPYLLDTYDLRDDDLSRVQRGDAADAQLAGRVRAFSGDDRLMKTLLLSALAPTVPALHNLTASRLSALNHGSVTSPIPGTEVAQVARKVETWAGRFPEIKYVKADDPGVGLELVGVDVESVLSTARFADSDGARKNLIKRLLYKELQVTETGQYSGDRFDLTWRGSKRSVEVICGNVRDEHDLRDDAFHPADPTSWRVILDYPFDEGDHTPADDRVRVQGLTARGVHDRTVCWIPATLSAERMRDLRQLVVIDYVLHGQRFDEHAKELNPTDRHRARQTLAAQRDVLRGKLTETLRQAYGLTTKQPGDIVGGFDEHLHSLYEGLAPRLASGATLSDAMWSLADQMLAAQYPAHPDFDPDRSGATVKLADAKVVRDYVRRATEISDGRVEVDKAHRATMRRIANQLLIGEMHEAAFVLGSYWRQHFHQLAAKEGNTGDLSVTKLLEWIDLPEPRGLDTLLGHLIIACFAEQSDRAFVYRGAVLPTPPELNQIKDEMSLREERLPDLQTWETARRRAMEVFGHNPPEARRTRLATMFARQLSDDSRKYRDAAEQLVAQLEAHAQTLGLDPAAGEGRLHTAQAAADLLEGLGSRYGRLDIIEQLATADLGGPAQRVGKSIKSAAAVAEAIRTAKWDALQHIDSLPAPYDQDASRIFDRLQEDAAVDELTVALGPALAKAGAAAAELTRRANADAAEVLRAQRAAEKQAGATEAGGGEQVSRPTSSDARAPREDTPVTVTRPVDRPASATRTLAAAHLEGYAAEIAAEHSGATIEISWRVVE
jgi:hypothetical protein